MRELHKTNYDLKEHFVIPEVRAAAPVVAEPATPSTIVSSPVSSVANSPVKRSKVRLLFLTSSQPGC